MTAIRELIHTFATGVMDPIARGLSTADQYKTALQDGENIQYGMFGNAAMRAGTLHVGDSDNNEETALIPFTVLGDDTYIFEFRDDNYKIHRTSDRSVAGFGNSTPYRTADLPFLSYVQTRNQLFIACPNRGLRMMEKPLDGSVFTVDHPTYRRHFRPPVYINKDKDWTVEIDSGGTGATNIHLVASKPTFFAEDIPESTFTSGSSPASSEEPGFIYLFKTATDPTNSRWYVYNIVAYTSSTEVECERTSGQAMGSIPDGDDLFTWGRSASRATGYQRAIAYHQDRIWLAGCETFPEHVASTVTGGYEDWNIQDGKNALVASDAININIADVDKSSGIQWMTSADDLLLGSINGEHKISGVPIKATGDFGTSLQTTHGAKAVRPVRIDASVMYASRNGHEIHEMKFKFEDDRYRSPALTDLAQHLFAGKAIKQMQFYNSDDQLLFVTTVNATDDTVSDLMVLAYRPENAVVAWSNWDGLEVVSMAVVPEGSTIATPTLGVVNDQVWMVVKRGSTYRIEIWQNGAVPLDQQVVYTSPGTTLTGLDHLDGEVVWVWADDAAYGPYTVASGQIDISDKFEGSPTDVVVGKQFTYKLTPNHPEGEDRNGTLAGSFKTLQNMYVNVNASAGGLYATPDDPIDASLPLLKRQIADLPATQPTYTGWMLIEGIGQSGEFRRPVPTITAVGPEPFNLLSMVLEYTTG